MPYITSALNDNSTYTLQATLVSGSVAVTILTIKTTGTVVAEILVSPNGARSVGNGVGRIVFLVNAPTGAAGTFKVVQSGVTLADLAIGGTSPIDLHVAFEVI